MLPPLQANDSEAVRCEAAGSGASELVLFEEIIGKKAGPVLDLVNLTAPSEAVRSICDDDCNEGAFGAIEELAGAAGKFVSNSIAEKTRLPPLPLDLLVLWSLLLLWRELRDGFDSWWLLRPDRELERDTGGEAPSSPLSRLWNCTPKASYPLVMLDSLKASFKGALSRTSAASIANALDASFPASRIACRCLRSEEAGDPAGSELRNLNSLGEHASARRAREDGVGAGVATGAVSVVTSTMGASMNKPSSKMEV